MARSCRLLWLAGGPSRRRDPRRKGLARRWCCARQVDAVGNLQVLGGLSGQHQPLYSGRPLGKAELCTVTSYADTTMAPLIDSAVTGVSGHLQQGRALAQQFARFGEAYTSMSMHGASSHQALPKIFQMSRLRSPRTVSNIWLYGGLVCTHPHATCLGKDRDHLCCPELGVLERDGTARKADTSSVPGIQLSGRERSLPMSKTPRSPSLHHHSSPTNRR